MNKLTICMLCTVFLASCGGNDTEPVAPATSVTQEAVIDIDAETRRAQAAIGSFAASLQAELRAAMQQGGPLNAINICHTRAIPIGENASAEQNLQLSRTSLRIRNPANAPTDWQIPVLESFDQLQAQGNSPETLGWSEVIEEDGRHEFRYMKAIPTGGLCLQCHGSNIAPEVSERLNELYPSDQATGFGEGDVRGAFVVTRTIDD